MNANLLTLWAGTRHFLSKTSRRVVVVLGCLRMEPVIGQPGR